MAGVFEFHKRLGSGHFGEVWPVTDRGLNTTRALKVIPKDKLANQNNFFAEAQTLKAAEHPNIVRVEETGLFDDAASMSPWSTCVEAASQMMRKDQWRCLARSS